MNRGILAAFCGVVFTLTGCTKYLDVVPDNTLKLENIFNLKQDAYDALAKVYSYIPSDDITHNSSWLLGDEWLSRLDLNTNEQHLRGIRIMRGLQSQTSPQLGYWSGTGAGRPLYEAIRQADVFLENIGAVKDMTDQEKREWSAQVKFLKAYYAFLLVRHYGPIVIMEEKAGPESTKEELFIPRSTVAEGFDFILDLINEAMPDLKERALENDLGQVDQIAAKAMKARILVYQASPFFNGNMEFFGDFVNENGEPFFPLAYDKEKWKVALDAINESIELAEQNGLGIYTYEKEPFLYDREAFEKNPDKMKTLYDLRMVITDPWNKELVWGMSGTTFRSAGLGSAAALRLPSGYGDGLANSNSFSFQWLGASYQMAERYYTANGLPLEEDLTYDLNGKHEVVHLPGVEEEAYEELQGYMQPGGETINLYLHREPRFYANLGITGGFWRGHGVRINTQFYYNTDGGRSSVHYSSDFLASGIGVQKLTHPESQSGSWQRVIKYPLPFIRMSDLYLMRAEALNEYYGPSEEAYSDINKIRRRAGIPDVQDSWGNTNLARNPNKHLTQEGLRDIILEERSIEFAFEGLRFWDMWRHKRAGQVFSAPMWGWDTDGEDAKTFFVLDVKQQRRFTITDYLWPIDLNEMNTNSKLIQNPGWVN